MRASVCVSVSYSGVWVLTTSCSPGLVNIMPSVDGTGWGSVRYRNDQGPSRLYYESADIALR